jgi:hypothetical protein
MASYRKRQGKWQAQVRLAGKPAISKTFPRFFRHWGYFLLAVIIN